MAAASSLPYIGSKISLISRALIRYDGILLNINTNEQTVGLGNVRCYGTEDRVIGSKSVLPSPELYDYVIFQGKSIKDITVSELAGPDDPAIVAINPSPNGQSNNLPPPQSTGGLGVNDQSLLHHYIGGNQNTGRVNEPTNSSFMMGQGVMPQVINPNPQVDHYNNGQSNNVYNPNLGRTSLDYNGRLGRGNKGPNFLFMPPPYMGPMYNLPYNKRSTGYGNYRSGGRSYNGVIGELTPQPNQSLKSRVAKAFNFEEANLKFNKTATNSQEELPHSQEDESAKQKNGVSTKEVYDKKSSFFDNISCETLDRQSGNTIKMDRIKQRQLDVETFGASAKQARPSRMGDSRMSCRRGNAAMGGYSRRGLAAGASGVNSAHPQHGLVGYQHVGPALSGYNPNQSRY